jgi:hypothetical protein
MTNPTCEFYSPINRVSSFGTTPVSDRMFSTMEFFPRADGTGGCIEWIVYDADGNDEFVEVIGIWWDAESKKLVDYDGVFDIPREALELLVSIGVDVEYYEEEMEYPLSETFKLTTNNK